MTPAVDDKVLVQQTADDVTRYLTPEQILKLISSVTDMATVTLATSDSRTNAVLRNLVLKALTSGTPAAGIGTGLKFQAESADEAPSDFGALDFAASDVSAGSEDTYLDVLTRVAGAALVAIWRLQATGAFKGILTHANTADRTYTLPNASGTIGLLSGLTSLQFVRKTANETVNNSSTLQNDDTLLAALAANEVVAFICQIWFSSATAADIKLAFTTPAAATIVWAGAGGFQFTTAEGAALFQAVETSGGSASIGGRGAGDKRTITLIGLVANGANAGNLTLQWAQDTADASDTIVYANSWLLPLRV